MFRAGYLARNPLCHDCCKEGQLSAATEPHHIIKVSERPDLMYDEDNLMPLCGTHHKIRTARGE